MGRTSFGSIFTRIITVLAVLVLVGIVLKLLVAILSPVLPAWAMEALSAGWGLLLSVVSPALAAIAALTILAAVVWVFAGRSW